MERRRRTACSLVFAGVLSTLASAPAAPAVEDPDGLADAVIATMQELPEPGFEFEAWINDGDAAVLAVGSDVVFHLRSARDANVTLVYLDQDAVVSLPIPTEPPEAGRIAAGRVPHVVSCDGLLPGDRPAEGCGLEAYLPLGFDLVWAVATREPLPVKTLGGPWNVDEGLERLRPADGPAFARALVDHVRGLPADEVAWVRLEQAVLELGEGNPELLDAYVEKRAARASSSPRRYRMPAIFFESRSAALDPRAQRSLETVARAMQRPEYATARIRLIGHTDAVGSAEANERLSRARAEAVREHLETAGVAGSRIEVTALGESEPLSPGDEPVAYRRNRRVELEILP